MKIQKSVLIYVVFGIALLVVAYILTMPTGEDKGSPNIDEGKKKDVLVVGNGKDLALGGKKGVNLPSGKDRSSEVSLEDRLSDALDGNNDAVALPLALKLLAVGNDEQKLTAMDALNWIGGPEAKAALCEHLTDADDLGARANEVLLHLFSDDANKDDVAFDSNAWRKAMSVFRSNQQRYPYMIVLDGYEPEVSVPLFMELLDSTDKGLQELGREFMTSTAGGEEIRTRGEAEKWLESYKREKAKSASED